MLSPGALKIVTSSNKRKYQLDWSRFVIIKALRLDSIHLSVSKKIKEFFLFFHFIHIEPIEVLRTLYNSKVEFDDLEEAFFRNFKEHVLYAGHSLKVIQAEKWNIKKFVKKLFRDTLLLN